MSQVILVKFLFKEGGKQIWLDWAMELKRRKDEVIETLKEEGVLLEACFISQNRDEVYYFMQATDFEKAKDVVSKSTHIIDIEHKEKKGKSLVYVEKMGCLFNFENK